MSSNRVFQKLVRNNVKKRAKDYLIYFLTLTLSVAMFYTFNSIGAQFSVLQIHDTLSYLPMSEGMIAGISLIICIIMGFLVVYANRFLMRKRKKEFGIYITLGMDRKALAALMLKETLLIGGVSVILGLTLGIFTSQILTMVTAKILEISLTRFHFVFSIQSILVTLIFYFFIFAVVHRRQVSSMKKCKLIELLSEERKNEELRGGNFMDKLAFFLSILCLAGGYIVYLSSEFTNINIGLAILGGIFLMAAGTFLFFRSLSGVVLAGFKKRERYYYKGIHMYTIGQIASRIKTANVSVSAISILIFLSIVTMSCGFGLAESVIKDLEKSTPYDMTINWYQQTPENAYERLETEGMDLDSYVSESVQISMYLIGQQDGAERSGHLAMSLSDFNRIRRSQGMQEIQLEPGTFAWNLNPDRADEEKLAQKSLNLNGVTLRQAEDRNRYHVTYQTENVWVDNGTLIVPDQILKGVKPLQVLLNCSYKAEVKGEDPLLAQVYAKHLNLSSEYMTSRQVVETEITTTNMTLSYLAFYLGVVFLISAGTVLALQQMSGAMEQKKRFALLHGLGVDRGVQKHSLNVQTAIYFFVPFALALLESLVVIPTFYYTLGNLGTSVMIRNGGAAASVILVIYGLYFMITAYNGRRAAGLAD